MRISDWSSDVCSSDLVMVVVFYLPYSWTNFAAAAVFGAGALTDWLDGWIARRYGMYSAFGAFLDPVADKLAVTVALFIIVQAHPTLWMALWAAIIVRDRKSVGWGKSVSVRVTLGCRRNSQKKKHTIR